MEIRLAIYPRKSCNAVWPLSSDAPVTTVVYQYFVMVFIRAEQIIEKFPTHPLRDRIKSGDYEGSGASLRIGYFVDCGVDVLQQEAAVFRLTTSVCIDDETTLACFEDLDNMRG